LREELVFDIDDELAARVADHADHHPNGSRPVGPGPGSSSGGAGEVAAGGARHLLQLDVRVLPELTANGTLGGVVAVATDRTTEREATAKLAWEQQHHQLTGLANASSLRERLTSDLARTTPDGGRAAVAVVDLDGFRLV